MKKFDIYLEDVLRILGGLILVALGIIIVVSRFQIPDITFGGYATNKALETIELLWAFGGHALGVILFVLGLNTLGVIQKLMDGWL